MSNKTESEKFRKLSVSALVTGILPYIFTPVIPFILDPASPYSAYFGGFAAPIMFSYIAASFSLAAAAVVCGSIDLGRVKQGITGNKGKGLDIAAITLGSAGIMYVTLVLVIILTL